MINAEYLLSKNPGSLAYGETFLKAAVAGGYKHAAKWMADLMFLANNRAPQPSLVLYILLKDSYTALDLFERAAAACRYASKLKPDDTKLASELRELAEKAVSHRISPAQHATSKSLEESLSDDIQIEPLTTTGYDDLMEEDRIDPKIARATSFFQKARKAAEKDNFDYAIELYLDGIRCTPDALEAGHLPLCELALKRQKKGGKKPSPFEKVKRLRGKTCLDQMINAEYLFAKDPDNLQFAVAMLKAAVAGGFKKTADWIANYTFQANNAAIKPSVHTYLQLIDAYKELGHMDKALAACQQAVRLKPNDDNLNELRKNLTAEVTVSRGKYDLEGDFRNSIKDVETQEKLWVSKNLTRTQDYRLKALNDARKTLERNPDLSANIFKLAEILVDLDEEKYEIEAIELLEKTYQRKKDFSYKKKAGEIRIRIAKQILRDARYGLENDPENPEKKAIVTKLSDQLNNIELEHFKLCVKDYPTDLHAKYEYAVRLIYDKKFDQAIPLFQEAQKDPRHRISALGKIGTCFFEKGWFNDSIDVFKKALDSYEIKDDSIAKDLRYNLARAYEQDGKEDKALEIYRKLAQLDFAYRDIRQRVDKLRNK
jgi:tetratricopeptide (TPR) repeat protein